MRLTVAFVRETVCQHFPASDRDEKQRSRKLFRFYPEVVNYLLMKLCDCKPLPKKKHPFRSVQPLGVTLFEYAGALFVKFWNDADFYDKLGLNDVFIKGVDASTRHNFSQIGHQTSRQT